MVIEILAGQDRVRVDGITYVREDVGEEAREPWSLLAALCREHKVDKHTAYDAARNGQLDARMPRGCKRGLRVRRTEFERWLDERNLVRWEA